MPQNVIFAKSQASFSAYIEPRKCFTFCPQVVLGTSYSSLSCGQKMTSHNLRTKSSQAFLFAYFTNIFFVDFSGFCDDIVLLAIAVSQSEFKIA